MGYSNSERGFAITELLIASVITLVVMGVAFTTFQDALKLNDSAIKLTDASQNLRAGTNLLVRDLLQTGRNIPVGGIPIPSGGVQSIYRPSPPGSSLVFNNMTATTLGAITTGSSLGPTVSGRVTDMITLLMDDPFLDELVLNPVGDMIVNPSTDTGTGPRLTADGSAFAIGTQTAWLQGDPNNGIPAIRPGDLLYFLTATGAALQTVTRVDAQNVYFDISDPFNLNRRNMPAGTITQILGSAMTVRRVLMVTYYVHEATPGEPRLMRALNHSTPQALAGVVEDLQFMYDLVDGVNNPTNVNDLPYTANGVTYTASQVRKVNVNVGVRSETRSAVTKDYLRHHVSTVTSLRNLAFIDRYQ